MAKLTNPRPSYMFGVTPVPEANTDEKVKASISDPTAGYLYDKITVPFKIVANKVTMDWEALANGLKDNNTIKSTVGNKLYVNSTYLIDDDTIKLTVGSKMYSTINGDGTTIENTNNVLSVPFATLVDGSTITYTGGKLQANSISSASTSLKPWSASITYAFGDYVMDYTATPKGKMYRSKITNNINQSPSTSGSWDEVTFSSLAHTQNTDYKLAFNKKNVNIRETPASPSNYYMDLSNSTSYYYNYITLTAGIGLGADLTIKGITGSAYSSLGIYEITIKIINNSLYTLTFENSDGSVTDKFTGQFRDIVVTPGMTITSTYIVDSITVGVTQLRLKSTTYDFPTSQITDEVTSFLPPIISFVSAIPLAVDYPAAEDGDRYIYDDTGEIYEFITTEFSVVTDITTLEANIGVAVVSQLPSPSQIYVFTVSGWERTGIDDELSEIISHLRDGQLDTEYPRFTTSLTNIVGVLGNTYYRTARYLTSRMDMDDIVSSGIYIGNVLSNSPFGTLDDTILYQVYTYFNPSKEQTTVQIAYPIGEKVSFKREYVVDTWTDWIPMNEVILEDTDTAAASPMAISLAYSRKDSILVRENNFEISFTDIPATYATVLVLKITADNSYTLVWDSILDNCWASDTPLTSITADKKYIVSIMTDGSSVNDLIINYIEMTKTL